LEVGLAHGCRHRKPLEVVRLVRREQPRQRAGVQDTPPFPLAAAAAAAAAATAAAATAAAAADWLDSADLKAYKVLDLGFRV
jgi:3-oxoacyl-ACP reductase-like protein